MFELVNRTRGTVLATAATPEALEDKKAFHGRWLQDYQMVIRPVKAKPATRKPTPAQARDKAYRQAISGYGDAETGMRWYRG